MSVQRMMQIAKARKLAMGMFDNLVPFNESGIEEGQFFKLTEAKIGNEIHTEYGEGSPALLRVVTEEHPQGKWFSVFGQALNNQIERMDSGDLPAEVAIVRKENKAGTQSYKVLATREQIENDDIPF